MAKKRCVAALSIAVGSGQVLHAPFNFIERYQDDLAAT
jgi:hypothetical protein